MGYLQLASSRCPLRRIEGREILYPFDRAVAALLSVKSILGILPRAIAASGVSLDALELEK
jgi:hypothetical protein